MSAVRRFDGSIAVQADSRLATVVLFRTIIVSGIVPLGVRVSVEHQQVFAFLCWDKFVSTWIGLKIKIVRGILKIFVTVVS